MTPVDTTSNSPGPSVSQSKLAKLLQERRKNNVRSRLSLSPSESSDMITYFDGKLLSSPPTLKTAVSFQVKNNKVKMSSFKPTAPTEDAGEASDKQDSND